MKIETVDTNITIKRRIDPDDNLIHFIRHNSRKRRHYWNKFVEYYRELDKDKIPFSKDVRNEYRKKLNDEDIDKIMHTDDENLRNMYCTDVILSVFKDINHALKVMKTKDKKRNKNKKKKDWKFSKLQYRSYDPFRKTFKVRSGNGISKKTGKPKGRIHFKNVNKFSFDASAMHLVNKYSIKLMEPIADEYDKKLYEFSVYNKRTKRKRYSFHHEDIKEIIFMEELGKFYIMLKCKVTFYNYKDERKRKVRIAGIDLGIRNPVTIFDHNNELKYHRLGVDALSRMVEYEKKCSSIQSAMDKKLNINRERHKHNPKFPKYSKRYRKLQRRFRRYHKKIVYIRENWRYTVADNITTKYNHIVVDEFEMPDNSDWHVDEEVLHKVNHDNRIHGMGLFKEVFRHMAKKNGCEYIHAPENTTCTCSICHHVNDHLPLYKKYLTCDNCNAKIDRDINAAINCYNSYSKKM